MDFLDLVRTRNSVRGYKPDPIEDAKLEAVLEAGRLAPSACNRQPWGFVVIKDSTQRLRLRAAYDKAWLSDAPVVIAVCCEPGAAWVRKQDGKVHGDVDCAIAIDHMTLAAHALGLGTCWVCAFDPKVVRDVLALPPNIEPVALFPVGYATDPGRPKQRKPRAEVVHTDRW